ncbi:MAG: carbon storage regulator [Ruminiclostridium sp.]|jgi:carbon storage regulator|nr:carbon storage regulator [Ruminiclostridium sp.]MCI9465498.1 carbon storage regulator [Ruminiclostridium sp.]
MLILQRKAGESLVIGEDITVRVMSVDGVRVRLAITAPEDVSILRSELVTAATANRDAAMEESAPDALLALLGDVLEKQEEPTELTHSPATPDGKED